MGSGAQIGDALVEAYSCNNNKLKRGISTLIHISWRRRLGLGSSPWVHASFESRAEAKFVVTTVEIPAPDDEDSAAMRVTGRDRRAQNTLQIKSLPMRYTAADSCRACWMVSGGLNGA